MRPLLVGLLLVVATPVQAEIMSYKDDKGRTVYVNQLEDVPKGTSARPVDLSHVGTNGELARDLREAVSREIAEFQKSPHCEDAIERSETPFLNAVWREQSPLLFAALGCFLLALLTPFFARRMGAARWLRVITFATPPLLAVGLVAHAIHKQWDIHQEVSTWSDACQDAPATDRKLAAQLNKLQADSKRRQRLADRLADM